MENSDVASSAISAKPSSSAAVEEPHLDSPPNCVMCESAVAIYRCPRCFRKTCSLKCCQEHKKTFDCNGLRDRTKFVSISEFSVQDLQSDYFLLEEVARNTDNAKRENDQCGNSVSLPKRGKKRKKCLRANENLVNPDLPDHWYQSLPPNSKQLIRQAKALFGIEVQKISPGMSKRKRNSTIYRNKTKEIDWRIEWKFPFSSVPVNLFEHRISGSIPLREILAKYVEVKSENAIHRSQLQAYVETGLSNLKILYRKEFVKGAKEPHYYLLDLDKGLSANLSRKIVVEFPELIVVCPKNLDTYKIVHDSIEVVVSTTSDNNNTMDVDDKSTTQPPPCDN